MAFYVLQIAIDLSVRLATDLIVMQTNRLSRNNLIGYCEIDLLEFLTQVRCIIYILGYGNSDIEFWTS